MKATSLSSYLVRNPTPSTCTEQLLVFIRITRVKPACQPFTHLHPPQSFCPVSQNDV